MGPCIVNQWVRASWTNGPVHRETMGPCIVNQWVRASWTNRFSVQQPQRPTTFHVCKTRGCYCSFELLMRGSVSPETCWVSYKHGIINFDTLLHLVGYFCMNHLLLFGQLLHSVSILVKQPDDGRKSDRNMLVNINIWLASLCLKANAEMVPKTPSCYCMLLM